MLASRRELWELVKNVTGKYEVAEGREGVLDWW